MLIRYIPILLSIHHQSGSNRVSTRTNPIKSEPNANEFGADPVPIHLDSTHSNLEPIHKHSNVNQVSMHCQSVSSTWTICASMPITLTSTNSMPIHCQAILSNHYLSVNFRLICQSYVNVWWIHPSRKIHDQSSNMTTMFDSFANPRPIQYQSCLTIHCQSTHPIPRGTHINLQMITPPDWFVMDWLIGLRFEYSIGRLVKD